MQYTIFSLAIAIFWVSCLTGIISLLRKEMAVLKFFSIFPLLMILALCIVRILLPVELPFTYVIESKKFLPEIQLLTRVPLFTLGIDINIYRCIIFIWISGAVFSLVKNFREYLRFKRSIPLFSVSEEQRLYDILEQSNLWNTSKQIKIIVDKCVTSPAVTGFVHPVIFLPDIPFSDDQLLGIFTHELAHFRLKHHFVKLVAGVISACFWWNPMFSTLSLEVAHALEMHSDKIVCSRLNYEQRKAYLESILEVLEHKRSMPYTNAFCCCLVEDNDADKLKQRFEMIIDNGYQRKKHMCFLTIPVILAVFLSSYAIVLQPYGEPTPEDIGETDLFDKNMYFFLEADEGYDLYESPDQFLFHIDKYPNDECFKEVPIYKNKEDIIK